MELQFEMTEGEIVALQIQIGGSAPANRRSLLIGWLALSAVFLALVIMIAVGGEMKTARIMILCWVGATLLLWGVLPLYRSISKRLASFVVRGMLEESQNKGLLGEYRVAISEAGIEDGTQTVQSSIKWEAVEKFVITTEHLFLFTSAISAFTIPRTAFNAANGELWRFVDAVRIHAQEAIFEAQDEDFDDHRNAWRPQTE